MKVKHKIERDVRCPLCRSRMLVNARIPRLSGIRTQYRCSKCGKTKTVRIE